jgi:hypothetical protein
MRVYVCGWRGAEKTPSMNVVRAAPTDCLGVESIMRRILGFLPYLEQSGRIRRGRMLLPFYQLLMRINRRKTSVLPPENSLVQ